MNLTLSKRITIFVISAILICSASIGIFAYILESEQAAKSNAANAHRALAIASTVNAALDPQQFSSIVSARESGDYYDNFCTFLDNTMKNEEILYLYILEAGYSDSVVYFAEGYPPGGRPDEPRYNLGDTEDVDVFSDEMYEALRTGKDCMSGVYDLGGFGEMVSAYSPIKDASGQVIGVIGVDLSVTHSIVTTTRFAMIMIAIIAVLCTIAVFVTLLFVRVYIREPICEMTDAAQQLAQGNINIPITKRRNDEIGQLAESFMLMVSHTAEQASLIERLADCDLTVSAKPSSELDIIGKCLDKMSGCYNAVISNVQNSIHRLKDGSEQISGVSQSVAQGSVEQSGYISQLTKGMAALADSIESNAANAKRASSLSGSMKENAETGNAQMEQMLTAVKEINDASISIEKVIKVIDDIAFQTNILALNAAVEAARAGVHGKGFAVVAEEVRNLASKSSEAAKDTGSLITNSIEKAALGAKIAEETSASLSVIVEGITQSTDIINKIALSGDEQSASVSGINRGIEQVAEIVYKNSASAEESAASSEELSALAHTLDELISQFKVDQV